MKAMMVYLFDRKNKARFKAYSNQLQKIHQKVLSVSLPNSLTKSEWRQLAQFEAMIRPAMNFFFTSQGNRIELAGEM
eukprot:2990695-Ditylum_brightwellii.AAC.1